MQKGIDGFLDYLRYERNRSENTVESYRRDLDALDSSPNLSNIPFTSLSLNFRLHPLPETMLDRKSVV